MNHLKAPVRTARQWQNSMPGHAKKFVNITISRPIHRRCPKNRNLDRVCYRFADFFACKLGAPVRGERSGSVGGGNRFAVSARTNGRQRTQINKPHRSRLRGKHRLDYCLSARRVCASVIIERARSCRCGQVQHGVDTCNAGFERLRVLQGTHHTIDAETFQSPRVRLFSNQRAQPQFRSLQIRLNDVRSDESGRTRYKQRFNGHSS